MLATYGILGTGPTKKNVIEDALNEIGEDNDFLLYGAHRLSSSEERVFNWMSDHEVAYTVFYNDKSNDALVDAAANIIPSQSLTPEAFLKELRKRKGTLLLLWDDENVADMEHIVFIATDLGIEIKDLTNGLVPIVVEGEEPKKEKPTPVPTEEVEVDPFTREELEGMPISVLRKNAKSMDINTEGMSKVQLIESILGGEVPEEKPVVSSTTKAEVTYSTQERETLSADGNCMVVVVMPNGTVVSTPATLAEVRTILGLG